MARCLDSIIENSYPKEFLTVLVCDGNSDDKTPDIIASYAEQYPYIKYLKNEKQTTPFALNLGIQFNQSDVAIILGAHSFIAPNYIEQCIYHLEKDDSVGCVGGFIENIYDNEESRIIGFAMSQSFGVGSAYFRTGGKEGYVDTVSFGAYRREVFEKIGYFDDALVRNQDDEFNFRVTQAGYNILLTKDIKSYYTVRASFKKLFKQYYQYGYWKVYVNTIHKQITTYRQLVPFLFVIFLFGGLALSCCSCIIGIAYLSIILIYLMTGLIISFKSGMNLLSKLKVVYAFINLHLSYGLGFAHGIYRFVIRKNSPDSKMERLTR